MVLSLMEAPTASAPEVLVRDRWVPEPFDRLLVKDGKRWQPRSLLGFSVFKALRYLPEDIASELLDRIMSATVIESRLALAVIRPYRGGFKTEDLGIVSRKVVTTAAVNYIAADFAAGASDINAFKYHGIGTDSTAAVVGDTALGAESTTALNPDSTRATGSQGSAGNVYTTVGTLTADGAIAAVEHGIFTSPTVGSGTLLDRSVFSTVNLAADDSLQSTYDLTLSAGG